MAQITLTPQRISDFNQMASADIPQLAAPDCTWVLAVDSTLRNQGDEHDGGTLNIPANRLALLDTDGHVYASMLPSSFYEMTTAATGTANSTASNLPFNDSGSRNAGITATVSSNTLTKLTGVDQNTRCAIFAELKATPTTQTSHIIDVSLIVKSSTDNREVTIRREMDMSIPSGSDTIPKLSYALEFTHGGGDLTIQISAEEAISVTVDRFAIVTLH